MKYDIIVEVESAGVRLDKFLAEKLPDVSRSRVQALIEQGHIRISGISSADASTKTKAGMEIAVEIPEPEAVTVKPLDLPLNVAFEDEHMLVINKPAGLTVHPGAGHADDTLVNALLAHCGNTLSGIGGELRPGIVHRLDKDTSGLMVVAKHDVAHNKLSLQLSKRTLKRVYLALCWGTPRQREGTIDAPISRSPHNRKKMAVTNNGKSAVTHYRVLQSFQQGRVSLVECRLETGRTHQIRVHMTHIGHAMVGDTTYGSDGRGLKKQLPENIAEVLANFPRQALHATEISFVHPASGETMSFAAPMPDDMQSLISVLD